MEIKEIIALVVVLLLIIAATIFLVVAKQNYDTCLSTESNGCPTYVCGYTPGTTDTSCVSTNIAYPPYRTNSDNKIECQITGLTPAVPT